MRHGLGPIAAIHGSIIVVVRSFSGKIHPPRGSGPRGPKRSSPVPRCFQWVDLRDRLPPTPNCFQQPGVPIAFKVCKARSLAGGNDDLPYEENSPQFRSVTLGNFGFYPVSSTLRHTLTLLMTTGVIAVGASD